MPALARRSFPTFAIGIRECPATSIRPAATQTGRREDPARKARDPSHVARRRKRRRSIAGRSGWSCEYRPGRGPVQNGCRLTSSRRRGVESDRLDCIPCELRLRLRRIVPLQDSIGPSSRGDDFADQVDQRRRRPSKVSANWRRFRPARIRRAGVVHIGRITDATGFLASDQNLRQPGSKEG